MLDIVWIRNAPQELDAALKRRGALPQSAEILRLDEERRGLQTKLQQLQATRNATSKEIGQLMAQGDKLGAEMKKDAVRNADGVMKELELAEEEVGTRLKTLLETLPNLPAADVPDGDDEHGNVEVMRWGTPRVFDFPVLAHDDVAEKLGMLDFERAAKIAGARFAWIQGGLAKLERALALFFLDTLEARGFTEVRVPYLVNAESLYGTGQLPKFEEDLFKTTDGRYLIPTSEVPLTNYGAERIFKPEELPLRFCSWTPCFRSEAGSAGRDTKGLIRMHQFDKVEMVQLVKPEESEAAHQLMVDTASELLAKLGLPHRVIVLCTGDMGFGARKTYDLEVWVPSQNTYREISSCSNCGDFQARRMNGRFKPKADGATQFIHTLNGSGLAVGRTLVAVLENYQQADGSVEIPAVLRPYMGGLTHLRRA